MTTPQSAMDTVRSRVHEASQAGATHLPLYSIGSRRFIKPSEETLRLYGPVAVGNALLHTLETFPARSPVLHSSNSLRPFFDRFFRIRGEIVMQATDDACFSLGFTQALSAGLTSGIHTWSSIMIRALGTLLQSPPLSDSALQRAWAQAGFMDFYQILEDRAALAEDAPPLKVYALETTARVACCVLLDIQHGTNFGDLGADKECLLAIQSGIVPVGYHDGILHLLDWSTT